MDLHSFAWPALVVAIILSGVANTLAKWTSGRTGSDHLVALGLTAGCYGTGLVAYAVALVNLPLAIAYPILVGGSMSCVLVLAMALFDERLCARQALGICCVAAGMLTITV